MKNNKDKFNKVAINLLVFLLLISLFINYQYYNDRHEQNNIYKLFLNHYYGYINSSLNSVNRLIGEDLSGNELDYELKRLSYFLNKVDYASMKSALYVKGVNPTGINLFGSAADTIINGTMYNEELIYPFGKGHKLNENESEYLLELKNRLVYIHEKLYSEETGQENRNLSKQSFNDIIRGTNSLLPSSTFEQISTNNFQHLFISKNGFAICNSVTVTT